MKNITLELKIFQFSKNISNIDLFSHFLSSDEKHRSQKYIKQEDREKFIIGRGILRQQLSTYLKTTPKEIKFNYSKEGKPLVASDISFNVSHSGDFFAVIIADQLLNLGVDIEKIDSSRNIEELAKSVFNQEEHLCFLKLDTNEKMNYFFERWTLKESLLKSIGVGLSYPMDKIFFKREGEFYIYTYQESKNKGEVYYTNNSFIGDIAVAITATKPFIIQLTLNN